MGLFSGKKGVIMGVANGHSLATGAAQYLSREGATLAYSHLPDQDDRGKMERRVRMAVEALAPALIYPCDVKSDAAIAKFFQVVGESFGQIDFLVHSIAYAPIDDIRCPTIMASRSGFLEAMDVSVYSFLACARAASSLMNRGSSIVTMSYFGGEKVVHGYNMMGVCKAALEMSVRYAAAELGPKGIRVNAISAGPIKTLASSAVGDIKDTARTYEEAAPLRRSVSIDDVGRASVMLLSDLAGATTGEVLHVDSGYNILGSQPKSS